MLSVLLQIAQGGAACMVFASLAEGYRDIEPMFGKHAPYRIDYVKKGR
jgi:hypothetical protein